MQIISRFTGWVFSVDSANIYTRGPMYYVYVSMFFIGMIMAVLVCKRFSNKYQNAGVIFLYMNFIMAVMSVVVQLVSPELRLDWSCIIVVEILCYIYYVQLIEQVDTTTMLLNRRCLESRKDHIKRKAMIIFIDIDDFKLINDTLGHGFGDECLEKVGKAIRKSFSEYGNSYRYGGDEFCIIITRNIDKFDDAITLLEDKIKELKSHNSDYPDISLGWAEYNPESATFEELLQKADQNMYVAKQNKTKERN